MDPVSSFIMGFLVLLLFTAFVKIATALSIFRIGIGLDGVGFGFATAALSLALAWVVMTPYIEQAGGVQSIFSDQVTLEDIDRTFRPFLLKSADEESIRGLLPHSKQAGLVEQEDLDGQQPEQLQVDEEPPLSVLASAFLISELKVAFQIGVLLLLPFVVIDLLVINTMAALGVQQISASVISFPLKILLFLAVDGWNLIVDKLLSGYI